MDLLANIEMNAAYECHVCMDENGKYELSRSEFNLDGADILLLTAYNQFSSLENVSKVELMFYVYVCV